MILQRKKQKVKVIAFYNTAIPIVKKADWSDHRYYEENSVPYRNAKEDSKYQNFIKHICVKHLFSFSPSEVSDHRKSSKNSKETLIFF